MTDSTPATAASGRRRMRLEDYKFGWWPCCDHCGCGTPDGIWPTREGHDDTCAKGCNDSAVTGIHKDPANRRLSGHA